MMQVPRIKNIRIINAQYNDGTQMYQDFNMPFYGLSATYTLMNGGGKSVLAMLLLQCIIPNYTISKDKPFKSMFKGGEKNRTTHVLLEWELDSGLSSHKTLLTGFCARRKTSSDENDTVDGVEYFNYTHLYDSNNDMDIFRIPLCHMDGNTFVTMSLSETRKMLYNKSDEYDIWIGKMGAQSEYIQHIKKYCILAAEGRLMGPINVGENNLKAYFKDAYGTSRTVIEKLLLNTTIECLNDKRIIDGYENNETNSELLANTLIQSQEDIKRLNDEIANMHETRTYHNEILKLVDANNTLITAHTEFEDAKRQTSIQYNAYGSAVNEKKEHIQGIEIELNDANSQRETVEINIDKLNTMQQNAIFNKGVANVSRLETEKDSVETTLKDMDHKAKLAIATNKFIDIQEYKTDILECQSRIENISKDNETVVGMYNTYGKTLYSVLSKEFIDIDTLHENERSIRKELNDSSTALAQEIGGIKRDIKHTTTTLSELNIDIEKARLDEKDMFNKCQKYPQLNKGLMIPEDELTATNSHLDDLKNKQTTLNDAIDTLRTSIEKDKVEQGRFLEKVETAKDKVKRTTDNISKFESHQSDAMEIVNIRKSIDINTCFIELETEIGLMHGNKSSNELELRKLQRDLHTVETYGFVLPEEFENALVWFNDKYGFAKSGVEYLKELSTDEQEKLLKQAPWLPKTIILTDDNFNNIIANPIGKLTNTIMDSSILLIGLSSLQKDEKVSLGDVFIPSRNTEHYIKILDKDNTIERIKTEIQKIEQKLVELDSLLTIETHNRDTLKSFIDLYPDGYEAELRGQYEQHQVELDKYSTELSEISTLIESNDQILEQTKMELSGVNQKIDIFHEKLETLTKLTQLLIRINKLQTSIDDNTVSITNLSESLSNAERKNTQISIQITEKEELIQSLFKQKNELESDIKNEFNQFKTMGIEILEEKNTAILRAEYESAKKTVKDVAGDITQLHEKIKKNKELMDKLDKQISLDGITTSEIEESGRSQPFEHEYIQGLKIQIKDIEGTLKKTENNLSSMREKQVLIKDKFNSMVRKYNARASEVYAPNPDLMDENQFRADIKTMQTEHSRLNERITRIEDNHKTTAEELRELEFNYQSYEGLCNQFDISPTIVDTCDELKDHSEFTSILKSKRKNVSDNENKFGRVKNKVMSNIADINTSEYFKTPIRDKLNVANTLEDARFNAQALETYSSILLRRMDDQQKHIDALKKVEEHVVNQALGIAKMYRDYLGKFPMLSRIQFMDETYDMIKINFDKCKYSDEQAENEMKHYIRDLIRNIEENKIDKTNAIHSLTPALLLNRVMDMKNIQLKMRKLDTITNNMQKFVRWEQIEASDSQTNAIFIIFLVVLMSYIRNIVIDRRDITTSKMMIIDNPFGSTSNSYLWDVIASILEQNSVQLICPTHSIRTDILKYFPLHFKLTTEPSASGRSRVGIKVEAKDETLNAIKRQQMYGQITLDI